MSLERNIKFHHLSRVLTKNPHMLHRPFTKTSSKTVDFLVDISNISLLDIRANPNDSLSKKSSAFSTYLLIYLSIFFFGGLGGGGYIRGLTFEMKIV